MINRILGFAAFLAISACSTEQANEALATKYIGTNVDSFFFEHGPPAQKYVARDGSVMYIWAEKEKSYYTPPTAITNVNYVGNTAYANTSYIGGGTTEVQCQVKIITNSRGTISRIESHHDTIGDWEFSRCHEIFGAKSK